jgi:putative FmdB family regulatory protein
MPTYDYRCDGCGHTFEEFQSFSAAVLTKCPKCAEEKLRRLIGSGAAILFKGGGFYETDYRSDTYQQAAKTDSEAGKAPETKTSGDASSGTSGTTSSTNSANQSNSSNTTN